MTTSKSIVSISALFAFAVGSASAFAAGATPASGEFNVIGNADATVASAVDPSSGLSRVEVLAELEEFQANPTSEDGLYRYEGGEIGWVRNETDGQGFSRTQVLRELARFREHPVSADGKHHFVGGEVLWIKDPDQHARSN